MEYQLLEGQELESLAYLKFNRFLLVNSFASISAGHNFSPGPRGRAQFHLMKISDLPASQGNIMMQLLNESSLEISDNFTSFRLYEILNIIFTSHYFGVRPFIQKIN